MAVQLRPDMEAADHISVVGCDACRCGRLTLRLHDGEGRVYAVASMSPAIAEALNKHMAECLARAGAGGLGAIVCEGTA